MLSVYTRHYPPCTRIDIHYRRCHCPKWIRGGIEHRLMRISAKTRCWAEAESKARKLEGVDPRVVMVESAVRAYIREQETRKLSRPSLNQSKAFLERQFLPWCQQQDLYRLYQVRAPQIREFRHSWNLSCATAGRRHERMRAFFLFCVSNGWLPSNPMNGIQKPIIRRACPTDYFTRRQFQRIVQATYEYDYGGGADCWHRARRMRALVLLMRWSGLAIKDAVMLERKALDADGALFLRRAKTGVPVFVPLPPAVFSLLRTLPSANPAYFFWSGNGDPQSGVKGYGRSFRKLFRIADVRDVSGTPKSCRSHMFRDTFAVELLLAGVPIDQVSMLTSSERRISPESS